MAKVIFSIGTNMGNRPENLVIALEKIGDFFNLKKISSTYSSEPIGFITDKSFYNIAASIETKHSPEEVLSITKAIESDMGRQTKGTMSDRIIDIDIVFYNDEVIEKPDLIIPHPRAALRRFVIEPAAEIEPNYSHPLLNITLSNLLNDLLDQKVEKVS
jgi:2-amino-4-hydroxy-6-hydroxymethyldihydropteridine diphosphokinase